MTCTFPSTLSISPNSASKAETLYEGGGVSPFPLEHRTGELPLSDREDVEEVFARERFNVVSGRLKTSILSSFAIAVAVDV